MELIRKWVQIVAGFLMNGYWLFPWSRNIYQGPLKVFCAPGLNCYSCPAATTYCPIGSLQHFMAGLRFSLDAGQYYFGLYVVGSMGLLGGFFGRMICGWACPFGFFQELLHKIPSPKFAIPSGLRYLKYAILLLFVILLPLLALDEFGAGSPWFCKYLCPAGTVEAGLPLLLLRPELRETIGFLFYSKFAIMVAFIVWAVLASRPFCRVACPLGAFYALFGRVRVVKLRLDPHRCTNCGACHRVCPMGVKFNESPDDTECIACLACMERGCQFGAISLDLCGVPLGASGTEKHLPAADKRGCSG
ncbi:MAG: 4Fe-4S binding protein [Desulfobulbaceae bacterium]|nr:4Fe-4S binding protein [Desulfobulbaceae bacterium]